MKNQNRVNFEPFCREFTSRPFCYVTLRKGELSPADVTVRVREIRFDEYYPAVAYLYDEQNVLILSQIQSVLSLKENPKFPVFKPNPIKNILHNCTY